MSDEKLTKMQNEFLNNVIGKKPCEYTFADDPELKQSSVIGLYPSGRPNGITHLIGTNKECHEYVDEIGDPLLIVIDGLYEDNIYTDSDSGLVYLK